MTDDDESGRRRRPQAVEPPHPIDLHVGRRLKLRREELNLSQKQLGEALGLTFQQIQKYEKAINRISAGRLWELAQALQVPVTYFYEDAANSLHEEMSTYLGEAGSDREQAEIARLHARIADQRVRRKLTELARAISQGQKPPEG